MSEPVVETSAGKVRGYERDGVYGFRGVPYGGPTGGANRWRAPGPAVPWTGVRDAIEFGPWAAQPPMVPPGTESPYAYTGPMSEDCLILNVWTSGLHDSAPKPVMVSLHGGAFTVGSGDLAPETLVARGDVVVVSINHRLGLLGHLYLAEIGGEEWADSGNAGQLDVVLALEWIRDNIAAFGGDPNRVMVFGCSGGSSKTCVLMGMPAAKGLFHRVNPIDAPFIKACEPDVATAIAEETIAELGVDAKNLHKLREMSWEELLKAQNIDIFSGLAAGASRDVFLRYYPVVDGRSLPAHPFDPVASPLCADVPMLIGSARDSMSMIVMAPPWNGQIDEAGLHELANTQLGAGAETVLAAYRRSRPDMTAAAVAGAIVTGRVMTARTTELAERKAVGGDAPVYLYRWDYPAGMMGARHGGELPFVFKNIGKASSEGFGDWSEMEGSGPVDHQLQDIVSETWVRFAHDGNPNHDGLPKWPSYSPEDRPTLIFDTECRMVNDPDSEIRVAYQSVPDERWP